MKSTFYNSLSPNLKFIYDSDRNELEKALLFFDVDVTGYELGIAKRYEEVNMTCYMLRYRCKNTYYSIYIIDDDYNIYYDTIDFHIKCGDILQYFRTEKLKQLIEE
jgi:hypothetical protein